MVVYPFMQPTIEVTGDNPDERSRREFGSSLSQNGDRCLLGAPRAEVNAMAREHIVSFGQQQEHDCRIIELLENDSTLTDVGRAVGQEFPRHFAPMQVWL